MTDVVRAVDGIPANTSPQLVRIDRRTGGEPVDGAGPVRGRHAIAECSNGKR